MILLFLLLVRDYYGTTEINIQGFIAESPLHVARLVHANAVPNSSPLLLKREPMVRAFNQFDLTLELRLRPLLRLFRHLYKSLDFSIF